MFLAGLVSSIYMSVNNTQIQLNVDDNVRGRVLSVYMLTWGLLPIGVLPIGIAADAYGAPVAVASVAALALCLILLTVFRFPTLRAAAAPGRLSEVGAEAD